MATTDTAMACHVTCLKNNSFPFSILYALGHCSLPIDCWGHLNPLAWSPRSLWVGQLGVTRGTFVQPKVVRPRSGSAMEYYTFKSHWQTYSVLLIHLVDLPGARTLNLVVGGVVHIVWRIWKPDVLTIAPLRPVYPCEMYSLPGYASYPKKVNFTI